MLNRVAVTMVIVSLISTPALAQKKTAPNYNVGDPNERICEDIILTGSRLAKKRFCGTRAQWEERRRLDREAVEAAQRSPCVIQRNTNNGPSC